MNYSGLYEATGYERRIDALKGALTEFVKAVSEETDTQGAVDNRIAIVGFSSLDDGGWFSTKYNNTEILTGENLTVSNNNGVQMSDATTNDYKTALITATASDDSKQYDTTTKGLVNTGNGVNDKLDEAINAITYGGGTQPEYGFQMAKSIFENRTNTTYTVKRSTRLQPAIRQVRRLIVTPSLSSSPTVSPAIILTATSTARLMTLSQLPSRSRTMA